MPAVYFPSVESLLRDQLAAQAAELEALRRAVRRLPAGQSFAAALRAAGDEPGAAAVEAALRGWA